MSSRFLKPSIFPRDFCSSFTIRKDTSVATLGMREMGFSANFGGQAYFYFNQRVKGTESVVQVIVSLRQRKTLLSITDVNLWSYRKGFKKEQRPGQTRGVALYLEIVFRMSQKLIDVFSGFSGHFIHNIKSINSLTWIAHLNYFSYHK